MAGETREGLRIGIDLGTTFSLAARMEGARPIVIPNALGETLTASAVSIADDGSVLVGAAARARAATHPERTFRNFKRDMGTDREWVCGEHRFTPEKLSALVLRQLKDDVEAATGETVVEAVITVPAYFGELQRRATRDAADIAGFTEASAAGSFDYDGSGTADLEFPSFTTCDPPVCGDVAGWRIAAPVAECGVEAEWDFGGTARPGGDPANPPYFSGGAPPIPRVQGCR